jgi:hypothetical protein
MGWLCSALCDDHKYVHYFGLERSSVKVHLGDVDADSREYFLLFYLFTAIGFAPGGSSPTLVQKKTIKQHYTVVQHNTIKPKHKIIRIKRRCRHKGVKELR